jgi:hypothetical protein
MHTDLSNLGQSLEERRLIGGIRKSISLHHFRPPSTLPAVVRSSACRGRAEHFDFREHPLQEEFGRGGGDPVRLKLQNAFALTRDLDAHVVDFPADEVEIGIEAPLR